MPKTQNRQVMTWLFIFAFIVVFLVVFGGYVRLTRSGLSIVEWHPVRGVIPPIGESAWQTEFSKYQQTPEFQKINSNITLDEYQRIFTIEWLHRLLARLAGIFYAVPVLYFILKGVIPRKELGIYILIGLLFIAQAVMGWLMVVSGLIDLPSVSHYRLTLHFLLALSLIGLSLWVALGHRFGFPNPGIKARWSFLSKLSVVGLGVLIVQISYGGFTAGLKAGFISNTWPKTLGQWIPENMLVRISNLIDSPLTIVFVHRWFAFFVLAFGLGLYFTSRKRTYPREILEILLWILGLGVVQIAFGVLVVISSVQIPVALIHQTIAVFLFGLAIYFMHRIRAHDYIKNVS